MSFYYNRDNIFNYQPVVKGPAGSPGSVGPTGFKGDTGVVGSTIDFRLYQELNGDTSYNSVNGYYALAKDTYPALNPSSSGVQAVSTWTQRTSPFLQILRSICWSPQLKLFVAVAGSGGPNQDRIATSSDGINWTSSSSSYFGMRSVCWSAERKLFVAVGINSTANTNIAPNNTSTNSVITSPDGINWTFRTSAGSNTSALFWLSVCWSAELGLFVAVAYDDYASTSPTTNRVMTSTNGINWFLQTSPITTYNTWYSVCWSPELGLFVAVSEDSNIMTSPDGINWTLRTSPVTTNRWGSVCWSAELGLFVAVGRIGTIYNNLITSPDGINWTSRTSANDNEWLGVCWSAELGLFVAVSESGAGNRVMTSPNGINWTERSNSNNLNAVCWSAELGIFVAVGNLGLVITSSLAGRPPTSYNVFNSPFNYIDQNGNWTIQQVMKGITTTNTSINLNVTGLNYCSIGNTLGVTITNLTGVTFQKILLYFENNNTTIQSNNNIRLQNGNTFAGTTFDTLSLLYTGTNWVEVSRSINQ